MMLWNAANGLDDECQCLKMGGYRGILGIFGVLGFAFCAQIWYPIRHND